VEAAKAIGFHGTSFEDFLRRNKKWVSLQLCYSVSIICTESVVITVMHRDSLNKMLSTEIQINLQLFFNLQYLSATLQPHDEFANGKLVVGHHRALECIFHII
jgi:hypothetical protein